MDVQFDEAKIATGQLRNVSEHSAASDWAQEWGATREVSYCSGGRYDDPRPAVALLPRHRRELPIQEPAMQGEHNAELLKELGFDAEQIESLYKAAGLVEPARGQ